MYLGQALFRTVVIPQYLLLSYYAGLDEYGELDEDGLPIYKSQGIHVTHYIHEGSTHFTRTACGRYVDRNSTECNPSESWDFDDASVGYDNLESWPGRLLGDHQLYTGSSGDFFGSDSGQMEFSYRTNPNTSFGDTLVYCDNGTPVFINPGWTRLPRNTDNSIYIEIKDEYSDHVVLDILLAPYEDITYPNEGELVLAGQPIDITWDDEHSIIDSVDIILSTNGGQAYTDTLVSGAPDSTHSYSWTPSAGDITDSAVIKIIYHNINTSNTCADTTDAVFSIVPASKIRYVNASAETGLDYVGTPYSSVSLD